MIYLLMLLVATLAAFASPGGAQDAAVAAPSVAVANNAGLVIDVQPTAHASSKRVAVTLQPNGQAESMSGVADVAGFPFIESGAWGDIDWRVNGSAVTGTIIGKDGHVVGHFEGTITETGMSGKVTHVDGRVGLWSWDGAPPQ